MALSTEQMNRWACQLLLPEIGFRGQQQLLRSRALIIGVGALGCGVAGYLVGAGVGSLALADHDTVELGNLHRQLLYTTEDVGLLKVEAAAARLQALHPGLAVEVYPERIEGRRAQELAEGADVVIDCTDTFESRYEINLACLRANKPLIHGACSGFAGQVFTILPGQGPCFRCLCPEPPPPEDQLGCRQVGILGPVAGIVASVMATEALKLLLGLSGLLVGTMLVVDAEDNEFQRLEVARWPDCPDCGSLSGADA